MVPVASSIRTWSTLSASSWSSARWQWASTICCVMVRRIWLEAYGSG
jgi:hypothetical protein